MKTPKTPISQTVIVTRGTEGHYENGQWVEPGEETIATIKDANVIPKSGRDRATSVQTVYESDYQLIAGDENIEFETSVVHGLPYEEIKRGDIVTDVYGRQFVIVFPGFFGIAHVTELKEILGD